jgi:hypothetical protein
MGLGGRHIGKIVCNASSGVTRSTLGRGILIVPNPSALTMGLAWNYIGNIVCRVSQQK